jgi:hypothetical protein
MGFVVASHGALYASEYGFDASFEALVADIAAKCEPGIHNHDREYGFRACAKRRIYDVQLHIGE